MTRGLSFIMLGSGDVEKTAQFYRERLGLTEVTRFENFAFLDAGSVTLVVTGELSDGQAELVFGVDSVAKIFEDAKRKGLQFVNEPRAVNAGNWAVNFSDPSGHALSFYGAY
jgi:catechol 2,3-dioxygenase-like lactoylglutathione lyase family enzyme